MLTKIRHLGRIVLASGLFGLSLAAALLQPATTLAAPSRQDADLPACSGETEIPILGAPCKIIRIVFIIDDSGSMGFPVVGNDLEERRFESVLHTADLLAEVYLTQLEAGARELPDIQIAAVHFATDIIDNSGWVKIAPSSREIWEDGARVPGSYRLEIEEKLISARVRNLVYNANPDRRTDFRKPLRAAADLLEGVEASGADNCPNRQVFLLTDGAPDEGEGELHRLLPTTRARSALEAHFTEVLKQVERINSPIYILAFRHFDRSYWDFASEYWEDQIATEALQVELGNFGDTGELPNLLDYVQLKVEQDLVGTSYPVPAYLQALEVFYEAPNAEARLEITDPEGELLVANGEMVAISGAGTVDQYWTIVDIIPGDYGFIPRDAADEPLPGGKISLRFIYPEAGVRISGSNPHLQRFTREKIRFQLLDVDRQPLESIENYPIKFSTALGQPGQQPVVLDLTPENGWFTIPEVLPLTLAPGKLDVRVVVQDFEGDECLLYQVQEDQAYQVDAVTFLIDEVKPLSCAPSDMPIRLPMTLVDVEGNPTSISLPILWSVAPVHEQNSRVITNVVESDTAGLFEFSLDSPVAGQITALVSASVEHEGINYLLHEENLDFQSIKQDRKYSLETDVSFVSADTRSLQLERWLGRTEATSGDPAAIGRGWFGWFSPEEIRVNGRFVDQQTGESIRGIERFQVQLIPVGSGPALRPAAEWQSDNEVAYYVAFGSPPLGDYDVVITDHGEVQVCVEIVFSGTRINLIRHYAEYLLLLALILLLLLMLGLFFIGRSRRRPAMMGPGDQDDVSDPPPPGSAPVVVEKSPAEQPEAEDDSEDRDERDNLQLIEGIGPKVEQILNGIGITTFEQLAESEFRIEEINKLLEARGYHYMYPYSWVEQARLAAAKDWIGFQRLKDRLNRGRPPGLDKLDQDGSE